VDGQQLTFNSLYTYGNYIDKVLYAFDMGSFWSYYYVHDHLYSPAALVDTSTPVLLERYEYDVHGQMGDTGETRSYSE